MIDLELRDVVEIVRVFSVLSKPQQNANSSNAGQSNVPDLFNAEVPQYQQEIVNVEKSYLQTYAPAIGPGEEITNIQTLSTYLLEQLRAPITKKLEQEEVGLSRVSIADLSELMYCYSAISNVIQKR